MPSTLSKEERLCGKTAVATLMSKGEWGHCGHFKYCILRKGGDSPNRILVSVPKRNFKRAVKRNLLKRRIREAYRTQKDLARSGGNDILFFYTASSIEEYGVIRNDIANILGQI